MVLNLAVSLDMVATATAEVETDLNMDNCLVIENEDAADADMDCSRATCLVTCAVIAVEAAIVRIRAVRRDIAMLAGDEAEIDLEYPVKRVIEAAAPTTAAVTVLNLFTVRASAMPAAEENEIDRSRAARRDTDSAA